MSKLKKCQYLFETILRDGETPCTACKVKKMGNVCPKKHNPDHVTATCWKVPA